MGIDRRFAGFLPDAAKMAANGLGDRRDRRLRGSFLFGSPSCQDGANRGETTGPQQVTDFGRGRFLMGVHQFDNSFPDLSL